MVLLVIFLLALAYAACAHYWQMAKDDLSSYEAKIAHVTVEIAKELDVKENARKKMEELRSGNLGS